MEAKHYLGAMAIIGMTCASGFDLPAPLSPFAGVAFAKARPAKAQPHAGKGHGHHTASHAAAHSASTRHSSAKPGRRMAALQPPVPETRPQQPAAVPAAPPVSEEEHRARLQSALEARAQMIAVARASDTTGSLGAGAGGPAAIQPAPGAQPRSVSFDFESGMKTTTFPGDVVVKEGFDLAAGKQLAATPPNDTTLARPKP